MKKDPFADYIKEHDHDREYRTYIWKTAIGLQQVDGLEPSKYLIETASQNIEGKLSFAQVRQQIDSYYAEKREVSEDRTEEADKVASRISEILAEPAFSFNAAQYLGIHRTLFNGIYPHAGQYRPFNITKKEWVLNGDTVTYGNYSELKETLEYDLKTEKEFSYKGLSEKEIVEHLARFLSNLWQNHVFAEGNTRATAVFFIKYLRTLGFDAKNDLFAKHAWYFRNALVRANYTNVKAGVYETTEYLELFLENLLYGGKAELKNRNLRIASQEKQ